MIPSREPGGTRKNPAPFSVAHTYYRGESTPATHVMSTHGTGHFEQRLRICSSGVRSSLSG